MLRLTRRLGTVCYEVQQQLLHHRQKATAQAAAVVKPFHYQDILQTKKLDTPWKKLSGTN